MEATMKSEVDIGDIESAQQGTPVDSQKRRSYRRSAFALN